MFPVQSYPFPTHSALLLTISICSFVASLCRILYLDLKEKEILFFKAVLPAALKMNSIKKFLTEIQQIEIEQYREIQEN